MIKTEKFSKIGNDEQEFGYKRAFRLPYTYRVQYVILIPRFFSNLTFEQSDSGRSSLPPPPQIIRARTPMTANAPQRNFSVNDREQVL